MARRWVRIVLVVVAVVAIGALLRYTVFRPEPVPVTVFNVARGVVEDTVTNSKAGTVKTRKRALLSPEIGGRVAELAVREGDRVRAGQLLMKLTDADYRAQLALQGRSQQTAIAARGEACLQAAQARREYERYVRLADEEIVSRELLEQLESNRDVGAAGCEAAEARVLEAKAAVELARVNLSKTVLRAPFDAVVARVTTEVGEWITPSPPGVPLPPILELLQRSSIYVSAPLDEVDVAKVEVGQTVRITIDAYPQRSFSGRVSRIAPFVTDLEEHNRTFEIEVEFDDRDFAATLLPGTSADVEVIRDSREDVLRIPSYALIQGDRVLVFNDGSLIARDVTTGLSNWAFTEVRSGLEAGERVVVSLDRAEVQEGAEARVAGETLR